MMSKNVSGNVIHFDIFKDEDDLLVIALCTNYNQIVFPSLKLLYIYMYMGNFLITVQLYPL